MEELGGGNVHLGVIHPDCVENAQVLVACDAEVARANPHLTIFLPMPLVELYLAVASVMSYVLHCLFHLLQQQTLGSVPAHTIFLGEWMKEGTVVGCAVAVLPDQCISFLLPMLLYFLERAVGLFLELLFSTSMSKNTLQN